MAGGQNIFVAGNVLTAAQVDAYLMDQSVMRVTSGTRPTAAAQGGSLLTGMTLYETDTDCLQLRTSGAVWQQIGPIGAWSTWSPTITALSGTITTVGALVAHYVRIGRLIVFWESVTITTIGSASGALITTLPTAAAVSTTECIGHGRDSATGKGLTVALSDASHALWVYSADNSFSGATGGVSHLFGMYEAAA